MKRCHPPLCFRGSRFAVSLNALAHLNRLANANPTQTPRRASSPAVVAAGLPCSVTPTCTARTAALCGSISGTVAWRSFICHSSIAYWSSCHPLSCDRNIQIDGMATTWAGYRPLVEVKPNSTHCQPPIKVSVSDMIRPSPENVPLDVSHEVSLRSQETDMLKVLARLVASPKRCDNDRRRTDGDFEQRCRRRAHLRQYNI